MTKILSQKIESCSLIWDKAQHNAFTDLIFFDQTWFCGFREASSHMSYDGSIRILKSPDGVNWSSFQELFWAGGDLRDPKFYINAKNQLGMLSGMRVAVCPSFNQGIVSLSWSLSASGFILNPVMDHDIGVWRWSASKNFTDGYLYSVGYARQKIKGALYRSKTGEKWEQLVFPFFPPSDCFANETSIVFSESGKATCVVRRDRVDCFSLLGTSEPPYMEWHWSELNVQLGGPKLIRFKQKNLISYRIIDNNDASTWLGEINPHDEPILTPLLKLPSGGDCSYPGLVIQNNHLYVSYYSSHEDKTAIYFACIRLSS
ncbi:hypothetical protein [Thiomicrorhabdus sp. Milos-T2]|uniref:hypothetical protein n=1 Tax=Thiomicrorhabdus sp. Milos-T2 TaxID=90814 RepID=UPI000493C1F3|nr:hypothetical protein [Thiomicrorhabdus sp. Milos-T2]